MGRLTRSTWMVAHLTTVSRMELSGHGLIQLLCIICIYLSHYLFIDLYVSLTGIRVTIMLE